MSERAMTYHIKHRDQLLADIVHDLIRLEALGLPRKTTLSTLEVTFYWRKAQTRPMKTRFGLVEALDHLANLYWGDGFNITEARSASVRRL